MENNYISPKQNKTKIVRRCKMCLKIKDILILIPTFRFICCNYKFWLKYMEKIQTHKDNRKDRSFLTAFSDNHEYNHLILHQNWTGISFIRVSCNVESEIISMNFSYDVTLKSIQWTFYS